MQAFNQRLWGFYTSSRKHFTFATEKFTEGNWSWNQEASHCWRHWFLTQTLRWGCSNALRVSLTSVWRDQWINGETRSKEHLLCWEVKVWISQQSRFGLPQTLTRVPLISTVPSPNCCLNLVPKNSAKEPGSERNTCKTPAKQRRCKMESTFGTESLALAIQNPITVKHHFKDRCSVGRFINRIINWDSDIIQLTYYRGSGKMIKCPSVAGLHKSASLPSTLSWQRQISAKTWRTIGDQVSTCCLFRWFLVLLSAFRCVSLVWTFNQTQHRFRAVFQGPSRDSAKEKSLESRAACKEKGHSWLRKKTPSRLNSYDLESQSPVFSTFFAHFNNKPTSLYNSITTLGELFQSHPGQTAKPLHLAANLLLAGGFANLQTGTNVFADRPCPFKLVHVEGTWKMAGPSEVTWGHHMYKKDQQKSLESQTA